MRCVVHTIVIHVSDYLLNGMTVLPDHKGESKYMFYEEWMSSDAKIAARAVREITDHGLLRRLALFGRLDEVRREALFQLDDPELWEKAAEHDQSPSVRRSAVRKITNRAILENISTNDADSTVRHTAQTLLNQITGD